MSVLLVHLPVGFEEAYPLALAAIAPSALEAGVGVDGLDVGRVGLAGLRTRLRRGDVDVVAMSVWSPGVPAARRVVREVREQAPRVAVITGGPHASLRPDDVDADAVVVGEGERVFARVLRQIAAGAAPDGLAGVWTAATPTVTPSEAEDLGSLPLPDRRIFPVSSYHRDHRPPGRRYTSVVTSRGCLYRCDFCSAPSLWGRGHRYRPAEQVADEWARLRVDHAVDGVLVEDDLFTQRRERVAELCERLVSTPTGVTWELLNGIRPETVDGPLLALMARAGCNRIAFSIECATPTTLRRMGRTPDLDRVREAVRLARASRIGTTGYFMLGLPGETAAERRATFAFARSLQLDMAHFSVASAWPGARWTSAELSSVPPRERSAYYAAWYLHPRRAMRAARMLGVRPSELPQMAGRLWNWMSRPLEARRVEL